MTDFIKFCPNCRTLFRDSDLYHRHLATCGAVQAQEAEPVKEPAVKTAKKRSQETGARSQEREESGKQENGIESETPDSCLLTPDSSPPPPPKPPKFKT